MKGSYILLLKLDYDIFIKIGALGKLPFRKGYYVYIGSAMNSISGRVRYHQKTNKKLHWHIDYLLKYARITDIFYKYSTKKQEYITANYFLKFGFDYVKNFGASDSVCISHLFYHIDKETINYHIKQLDFKKMA